MKYFLLPGLEAKRNAVRVGSVVLKLARFFPLPALCQGRAVSFATVPFSFSANGKALPAGEYMVYRDGENFYSLRTRSGVVAGRFTVGPYASAGIQDQSKLVFRSNGEGYYLDSIWSAGSSNGVRLLTGRRKRAEVAASAATSTVMVASTDPISLQK